MYVTVASRNVLSDAHYLEHFRALSVKNKVLSVFNLYIAMFNSN